MIRKPLALILLTGVLLVAPRNNPLGQAAPEVVLRPGTGATAHGGWTVIPDASAASGAAVRQLNSGAPKLTQALAQPVNYFEQPFSAEAGVPYRLWLRGRAQSNHWGNDSVFVQFTNSLDTAGASNYRIGTTSALEVNQEECSGCGLSGWGWQDTGWGPGVLGPQVMFETSGTQTIRIQTREDGFTIDQIVLSPQRYLTQSPGALKNDTTIVPINGQATTVTMVRRPYLQQVTADSVIVVWATRESGLPSVRITSGATSRSVNGVSRLVRDSGTGLGYDYYHHEVTITALTPGTSHAYDAALGSAPIASATFRTAPATGSGETTFMVWGDSGTGSSQQRQLATVMANDTFDLALHAGDIAYGSSGGTGDATFKTYNDWFFDVYAPWLPSRALYTVEGNHDSRPANGDGIAYLDSFTLPRNGASPAYPGHAERYYSFDYGRVHFVALDTEYAFQDMNRRAEQLSWLESDLAQTAQPWKVAVFHRSPYSAGGEHGSDLAVRAAFGPILERYGVQLAFSAHEHTYERTVPQRDSASGPGVTYVVTGGGGAPLYPSGTAGWTAYSASRHHYVKASVTECTMTLRAVGLTGTVFDTASIARCEPSTSPSDPDVVLYASEATRAGRWLREADGTAAGGYKIRNPDGGAAKRTSALATPSDYLEMAFNATAGVPYRLWLRGHADGNSWANDSVFVQFDQSVNASNSAVFRIDTTGAAEVNLEDCSGCGLSRWGWQDNGWGTNVRGPLIYFSRSGEQRIKIQPREDGLSIDQIVLSPGKYLTSSPGALKNDTTILNKP